jgi:hypothetical protein
VTLQIGNHGLFCLDDDDYAAYALAMACNAAATDVALTGQTTALDGFRERPYVSSTNASAQVIFNDAAGGSVGPEELVGANMTVATFNNQVANGIDTSVVGGYPVGFYMIGASINWTVATPTNNTRRMLMVYGVDTVNGFTSSVSTYTDLYVSTDYEGTTGNVGALSVAGMLHNDGNLRFIESFFTHQNTGSTINVAVGQWRAWAIYLGTGAVI